MSICSLADFTGASSWSDAMSTITQESASIIPSPRGDFQCRLVGTFTWRWRRPTIDMDIVFGWLPENERPDVVEQFNVHGERRRALAAVLTILATPGPDDEELGRALLALAAVIEIDRFLEEVGLGRNEGEAQGGAP